jgi:hypothetical protein
VKLWAGSLGRRTDFQKKVRNHAAAIDLHYMQYNFCRIHKTLRVTPAMEAGLSNQVCTFEDLAMLIEASMPKPGKRGPYQKQTN